MSVLQVKMAPDSEFSADWMTDNTALYLESLGFMTSNDPEKADVTVTLSLNQVIDPLVSQDSGLKLYRGALYVRPGVENSDSIVLRSRVIVDKSPQNAHWTIIQELANRLWARRAVDLEGKRARDGN